MNIQTPIQNDIDLTPIKSKQQIAWGSGDYSIVGTTLQIVGERLCEAVDLRSTHRVLDVAAGNGNASLAAARRFAEVVSTDYVATLLDHGRARAKADRLPITFQHADAEQLPFPDENFDIVLSTFGVMFTPHQAVAANELARVCNRGGRIGLANWTPESFIGGIFKTIGKYIPPAPGVKSPALWGNTEHVTALFGGVGSVNSERQYFNFRYKSPSHFLDVFRKYYGPVLKAFAALDTNGQVELEADIRKLMADYNIAKDGTIVIPSEYLEVVVTKAV